MFGKFLAALGAALICAALLWLLRQLLLTPVRPGKNTDQELRVTVNGPEPALENYAAGLLWLNDSGVLRCRIVIAGRDLDGETRQVARALARDHSCITFTEEKLSGRSPGAETETGPHG